MPRISLKRVNFEFILLTSLAAATGTITIALFAKSASLLPASAIYFCQKIIRELILQIPHSFHYLFLAATSIPISLGIISFLLQLYKTQSLLKKLMLKKAVTPERVRGIILSLGLGNKVKVIKEPHLFSFSTGVISPSIIITTGLVRKLNRKELEAVFLHEQAHLKNFDPFKTLLAKTFSTMFFFLPIFSQLNKNMATSSELLADNRTVKMQQTAVYLKSAIRKILAHPKPAFAKYRLVPGFAAMAAVSSFDSLEIRIQNLINSRRKYKLYLSPASLITTILFILLALLLLQAPVAAFPEKESLESAYFKQTCKTHEVHSMSWTPDNSPLTQIFV